MQLLIVNQLYHLRVRTHRGGGGGAGSGDVCAGRPPQKKSCLFTRGRARCVIRRRGLAQDYSEALLVMEMVVAKHPDGLVYSSQLVRLHLQMGNISGAAHVIQRAEKRLGQMRAHGSPIVPADGLRHTMDRFAALMSVRSGSVDARARDSGLLAIASGHFADAVARFEEVLATDPSNVQVRVESVPASAARGLTGLPRVLSPRASRRRRSTIWRWPICTTASCARQLQCSRTRSGATRSRA